jgi:hypothetical protein
MFSKSKIRFILLFLILINQAFLFAQNSKKIKALKKINTVAQAEAFIKKNGPTSARIGNFNRIIDSVEYKEIKAAFRVGDVFFDKRLIYKIIGNEEEPLFRCEYLVFDGNKMSKNTIDSLRSEIIKQYQSGVLFKSLAKQYSIGGKLSEGNSGWFRTSKMGEEFCIVLDYKDIGDIYLYDDSVKNVYYVVLKTHSVLCADSWVFVAM